MFAIGMAHYLITRPDVFHTAPLAVMVARARRLGDHGLARVEPRGGARALPASVAALAGARLSAVALAYAIVEGLDRRWLELRTDYAELRLPVADGVRVRTARASRARAARCGTCARDVAPRRADLRRHPPLGPRHAPATRSSTSWPGRPNPTRYDIQAPGVVTSAPVQREIVRDLERTRTPLVVRWTAPISAAPEPNRGGEPTGITILDDYLRRAYRRGGALRRLRDPGAHARPSPGVTVDR